jgi:hypothetical protein
MLKSRYRTYRKRNKRKIIKKGHKIQKTQRRLIRGGGLCKVPLKTSNSVNNYNKENDEYASSTWPVYLNKKNPDILIKKFGYSWWVSLEEIENEIKYTQIASDLKVGPKLHYWCIDKSNSNATNKYEKYYTGYLVIDKIEGHTLNEKFVDENPSIVKEVIQLLDILYDNGIGFVDRNFKNFMYGKTQSHPKNRVWIIDYGEIKEHGNSVEQNKRKYNLFD